MQARRLCRWMVLAAFCALWPGLAGAQAGKWQAEDASAPQAPAKPPSADFEDDASEDDAEQQREALERFEPELSPYGSWRVDGRFGRVWVPRASIVGAGFVPYQTGGHWTLTDQDDWFWQSDYPFGWVAFHYGRWALLGPGVWGWVPGYRYAPAWVDFRIGARGYIGWAPRAPRRYWRGGAYVSFRQPFAAPFVFCPTNYIFAALLTPHIVRDQYRVARFRRSSRLYRSRRRAHGRRIFGPSLTVAGVSRAAAPRRRVSLSRERRWRSSRGANVRKPTRRKATRGSRSATERSRATRRATGAERRRPRDDRSGATRRRTTAPSKRKPSTRGSRARPETRRRGTKPRSRKENRARSERRDSKEAERSRARKPRGRGAKKPRAAKPGAQKRSPSRTRRSRSQKGKGSNASRKRPSRGSRRSNRKSKD